MVVGDGLMESLYALEDQFHRRRHALRTQHLDDLAVDLLHRERLIDALDGVFLDGALRSKELVSIATSGRIFS